MVRIWNKHKQSNTPLKRKVFVMLSGGVDSSVAAALLKERGFDVVGVHIKMWSDPEIPCNFKEDRYDAMRVAAHLDIPFATWDLTEEYKKEVVAYMIREYAVGRTPNPDVMCNREIKFGAFFRRAMAEGADFVATGHYVRLGQNAKLKMQNEECKIKNVERGIQYSRFFLNQAKDLNKDQSYFLWTLTQAQLRHCLFPLGEYTKPEVREMARKFGLSNAEKPDSQGICFIGEIDLCAFLKKYIPERRGAVVTTSGKAVGKHEGTEFYTLGQRRGMSIGGGVPYYVAQKNEETNTLVVAEGPYDQKLFTREITVRDMHWISGVEPKLPLACMARIRYRQPLQKAKIINAKCQMLKKEKRVTSPVLFSIQHSSFIITFDEPQRAATPGQSAVFYSGDSCDSAEDAEMLGGGIICS
ncbi:MAG: tRNA 2-thiouridine(34) synthase MnmA [Candidatus Sungbacteria bacterium]|nr:tRNA 2-thiouridine(34) synthase MnmA [Candidatus Sungbacteria bacterium]